MQKHFTISCYIFDGLKTLLLFHPKHKKWLPPGGHLEENETPVEGIKREVLEETGLEIAFFRQENLWIEETNAASFERPYLCLLENVPAHGKDPAHQHIDLIYVAYPVGGILTDGQWLTEKEVALLVPGKDIFADTPQVIRKVFAELPTLGAQV